MAFIDYQGMLRGWCDRIDPNLAPKLINYAWRDIRDARVWSFLVAEGAWVAADRITSGHVSVTNNSATVQADATAQAALNAAAANPPLTDRQFRLVNGLIYNIQAYNSGTGVITLDRPFEETTTASGQYQVYRCYYTPPSADFKRLLSIVDPIMVQQLELHQTRQHLDYIDPQRASQTTPRVVAGFRDTSTNEPRFEMWPHPLSAQAYGVIYEKLGQDFSADDDSLPDVIPEQLLMERAYFYGFRWLLGNLDKANKGQAVGITQSIEICNANYERLLQRAKVEDEDIYPQNLRRRSSYPYIGGQYMQSHWIGPWT
jgi:hypothetical protein